ncbi:hypothetical protein OSTOST_25814, partial [Ostertagia ostertagi]
MLTVMDPEQDGFLSFLNSSETVTKLSVSTNTSRWMSTNVSGVVNKVTRILFENVYGFRRVNCQRPFQKLEGRLSDATRSGMPIRLIFRPPPTLHRLLTSSRLYEEQWGRINCTYCQPERKITLRKHCSRSGVYAVLVVSCWRKWTLLLQKARGISKPGNLLHNTIPCSS